MMVGLKQFKSRRTSEKEGNATMLQVQTFCQSIQNQLCCPVSGDHLLIGFLMKGNRSCKDHSVSYGEDDISSWPKITHA